MKTKETRLLTALFVLFWIPRIYFYFLEKNSSFSFMSILSPLFLMRTVGLDFAFLAYTLIPIWAFRILFPTFIRTGRFFEGALLFIVLFMTFCEPTFMNDLQARYNFIAVDYIVYSHEVIRNIWQSYPVIWMVLALALFFAGLCFAVYRFGNPKNAAFLTERRPFAKRMLAFATAFGLIIASHYAINEDRMIASASMSTQEIAKNGTYALFAAYGNNTLDFFRFYESLTPEAAQEFEAAQALKPKSHGIGMSKVLSRPFNQPPNVILVLMESMSAKFMKSYGSTEELTPNLDRLTKEGVWFSNLFATGSRTVRGIEAVMLSLPPTPGQSIVRRPGGENLYNLGTEFQNRGYATTFVYGGRGFFDNMGPFFSSNGFEIVDKSRFTEKEQTFATAWGLCDEDLFNKTISEADRFHEAKKPFFQFLLTTSNHRPYQYPKGKVPIGPGSIRQGAVQYADYSIGEFLKNAKSHPWFDNTIFMFVADHNASVAGGSVVLPAEHLIPVIFYAPNHLNKININELASQVDVGPTLYDILGWNYDTKRFYGTSIISNPSREAFFGNYQSIGKMRNSKFVLLKPKKRIVEFDVGPDLSLKESTSADPTQNPEVRETISDYSAAYRRYVSGELRMKR